ncbi:type II secretion system F family protein [Nocardioides jiangxiensis]|uniref:Type II secretion system F family protein n=1 Tax=Nocardioides jiangxiensis TaxID=3064524 RepID=A0ABT9B0V2_9ACTN|nr:type II secretion system F family protein [Nocardioides sp. WY-20]MDO7868491.1 type II secretion system F family protein [Nocardioides sp. WY-20]
MTGATSGPLVVGVVAAGSAVALAWPASAAGLRLPSGRGARGVTALLGAGVLLVGWPGTRGHGDGAGVLALGPVLLCAAVVVGGAWLRRGAVRRREMARRGSEVLELCEELAGDLEAGAAPALALRRAASRWPVLGGPATAHALGGAVPEAWRELARRPGAADLHVVAAAWQVAEQSGAGLADALTAVADGLREQQRTRRLVASELASARATARLMAALPVLTLAVGSGAGDPVGFLLGTPAGLLCATAGLVLGFAGVAWIEAIAGAVERDAVWMLPGRGGSGAGG